MTYPVQQQDGLFYTVYYIPQDAAVQYPMTDQPIPDELKDTVPKYDWQIDGGIGKWVDSKVDPNTAEIATLKGISAIIGKQLASAVATADQANKAVAALTLQVAQDIKPPVTPAAPTSTATSAASTSDNK
jgi:hypothetical protein